MYTHGAMLPAYGYPAFRKHAHLKGNYGGAWHRQQKDFASWTRGVAQTLVARFGLAGIGTPENDVRAIMG